MTDEAKSPLRRRNQQCAGDRAGLRNGVQKARVVVEAPVR
jgi:hypothetical protein